jgi:hypothetical protein
MIEEDRKTEGNRNLTQWIKVYQRDLDRRHNQEMLEIEKLLRDYLVAMLDLAHRQLLRGKISLSEYYQATQMLAYCGETVNKVCQEEISTKRNP